jgi:dTDP-4-dehydrorhamnose reductase
MNILVIGRTGQLAQSLIERGGALGHTVVALEPPELDLQDRPTAEAVIAKTASDVIINAAAYTAVDAAETDYDRAYAINIGGAETVARAAAASNRPLIHISTDYVFTGDKLTAYREDDPTGPLGVYGWSKLRGEALTLAACQRSAIARTSWLYSPYGGNFVKTMLRLAQTRPEIKVVADQWGAPTYAPDLAEVLIAMAIKLVEEVDNQALTGVFHLTGPDATNWAAFAEAIFANSRAAGLPSATVTPITTEQYPTAARRPARSVLDLSKIKKVYGVSLPPNADALTRCIAQLAADTNKNAKA